MNTRIAAGIGVLLAFGVLLIVWVTYVRPAGVSSERQLSGQERVSGTTPDSVERPALQSAVREAGRGGSVGASRGTHEDGIATAAKSASATPSRLTADTKVEATGASPSDPGSGVQDRLNAIQATLDRYPNSGAVEQETIRREFRGMLSDADPVIRSQALDALSGWGDQSVAGTVRSWVSSETESPAVRAVAIRHAAQLGMTDLAPTIRKYLRDSDEITRITAITALSQMKDRDSRPAFEEAASDTNYRIARAGRRAIEYLDRQPASQQ